MSHGAWRRHRGAGPRIAALALSLLSALPLGAQQREPSQTPLLLSANRFDILVVTAASIGTLGDQQRLGSLIGRCSRVMRVSPEDSARVLAAAVWNWSGGVVAEPGLVSIVVLPAEALFTDCGDRAVQSTVAAARAIRFTYDSLYAPERDVERLTLRHGRGVVVPAASERAMVLRLTPRGLVTNGASAVRLAVPLDSLAPASTGVRGDLVLEIWNARDSVPEIVELPWSLLERVWNQMLALRVARADRDVLGAGGLFVPPVPRDKALQDARQRYLDGAFPAAGTIVLDRLHPGELDRADAMNARVQLAMGLAAAGDAAGARVVMGRVIADHPCFSLSDDAPAYARALADSISARPARCQPASIPLTLARAALLPGFGRPASTFGRRLLGVAVAGTVGASVAIALSDVQKSRETYDQYLAMDWTVSSFPGQRARSLYVTAERQRTAAKRNMTIGVSLWTASIVESVVREHLFARYLAGVQRYGAGAPSRVRLAPLRAPGQVGLSLTFF